MEDDRYSHSENNQHRPRNNHSHSQRRNEDKTQNGYGYKKYAYRHIDEHGNDGVAVVFYRLIGRSPIKLWTIEIHINAETVINKVPPKIP